MPTRVRRLRAEALKRRPNSFSMLPQSVRRRAKVRAVLAPKNKRALLKLHTRFLKLNQLYRNAEQVRLKVRSNPKLSVEERAMFVARGGEELQRLKSQMNSVRANINALTLGYKTAAKKAAKAA